METFEEKYFEIVNDKDKILEEKNALIQEKNSLVQKKNSLVHEKQFATRHAEEIQNKLLKYTGKIEYKLWKNFINY